MTATVMVVVVVVVVVVVRGDASIGSCKPDEFAELAAAGEAAIGTELRSICGCKGVASTDDAQLLEASDKFSTHSTMVLNFSMHTVMQSMMSRYVLCNEAGDMSRETEVTASIRVLSLNSFSVAAVPSSISVVARRSRCALLELAGKRAKSGRCMTW